MGEMRSSRRTEVSLKSSADHNIGTGVFRKQEIAVQSWHSFLTVTLFEFLNSEKCKCVIPIVYIVRGSVSPVVMNFILFLFVRADNCMEKFGSVQSCCKYT